MSSSGSPALADRPPPLPPPSAAGRHPSTGALGVALATGLTVSTATAIAVAFSGAPGRRTVLGVLLALPWGLGCSRVAGAARLLSRPWRTTALALALGGLIAADGTWGSPFVAEGFVLVAVAVAVDDAAGVVACVIASVGAYLGGLVAGGVRLGSWMHDPHVVMVANNALDFPIVAGVLWAALTALRQVLAGPPGATMRGALPSVDPRSRVAPLTDAERRVATLLADGLAAKQIATELAVGLPTVRTHIAAAKRKTGARTIEQLAGIVAQDLPEPAA
jgi:DNA-binding CsgD family transcriptional regulator